jgi:hypothetical protein
MDGSRHRLKSRKLQARPEAVPASGRSLFW